MAVGWAGAMKTITALREMPPWPPGPLSPKMLHDRSLTAAQIATFAAWAEGGAPLGDAAHPAPPGQPDFEDIGVPDFTADMGVDYVPDTSLTDDYHCFLIDLQRQDDRMIVGYRITPGNGRTVHHVITSLFAASDRATLEALDAASPERAGWPCVGGPVPADSAAKPDGSLGAWVPGVSSVLMPAGTATALHAGDLAVMQVHYNLLAGHDPDRTKIEVKLAPAGTEASLQQLATLRLVKRQLDLPANQAGIVQENTYAANVWTLGKFYPDGEAWLVAIAGHMHLLGTHITSNARTRPARRRCSTSRPGTSTGRARISWRRRSRSAATTSSPFAASTTTPRSAAPKKATSARLQTSTGARARRTRCASGT